MPIGSPIMNYVKVGDWLLGDIIGEGSDGVVRLALNQHSQIKAAVKTVSVSRLADQKGADKREIRQRLQTESGILSYVSHPHIVSLYETIWDDDNMYLVMEYVSGGELIHYIHDSGTYEEDAKYVFWQLLSAVHYCHLRQIVHRDLKLDNILVVGGTNKVKIADFGYANMWEKEQKKFTTICGTTLYLAPEVMLGLDYTGPPVDIWALGVILYAILTGQFPFADTEDIASFVVSGKYKIPNVVSVSASKLIRKMLATNPKERVTFKDIVRSDWLKQTVEDHIELMPSDPVDIVRKSELCSCQIRHERLSSDGKMQMYIASGDEQRQVESRSCSSDGRSIGAEKTSWGSLKRSVNRKWSNLWRRRVLSRLQSRSK